MSGRAPLAPEIFFLDAPAGRRLCGALFEARKPGAVGRAVLYLPPFAEEMNRTRRMAALAARALATAGHPVLLLDATGTGDSSGDFAAATWQLWLEDFSVGAEWLKLRSGAPPVLLAARSGALLAPALLATGAAAHDSLALWQPVTSGKQYLTQFLRLKLASDMGAINDTAAGGTKALRASLERGDRGVEIAGYELNADLARGLDEAALDAASLGRWTRLGWFESGGSTLLPASARLLDAVRAAGASVTAAAFAEPPYWVTPETTVAPGVVAATCAFLTAVS